MESASSAQISNEKISELLQSLLQNAVTRDDLKEFATREDISQLERSFRISKDKATEGALRVDDKSLLSIREQIKENQEAVDKLFMDMANNKKVLLELRTAVQALNQEFAAMKHEISDLGAIIVKAQTDFVDRHSELSELVHNVEANTRVVGKMASVVTDIDERLNATLTNNDLGQFRSEIIQRLDHIVKRLEIYDHEQVSIKVGMKRMEKIQKDEMVRNDKQDSKIKKAMEKIEQIAYKINQAGS